MTDDEAILIAVDKPAPSVVVTRVAGKLDGSTCTRLLRVISTQMHTSPSAGDDRLRALVVDLAPLSRIDADGLRTLARAEYLTGRCGARLFLTGLTGRRHALPGAVIEVLRSFTELEELDHLLDLDMSDSADDTPDVQADHPAHVRDDLALAS